MERHLGTYQHLLELLRQPCGAGWNVKVSDNQNKLCTGKPTGGAFDECTIERDAGGGRGEGGKSLLHTYHHD